MTARMRGKCLSRSFVLLCLSGTMTLLYAQHATASVPNRGNTSKANPEINLPPRKTPPEYLRFEELFPESSSYSSRLVIKLSDRRVYVYKGDRMQASYPIAVGKSGWETPKGHFKVLQMQQNPAWQHPWNGKIIPPGPDNPLGARWIGFWTDGHNFIGFHGTPNEELVGQAVSHGCIRMRNKDVLALYEQVKIGTPVSVEP